MNTLVKRCLNSSLCNTTETMESKFKSALLISLGINVFIFSLCLFSGELRFGALDDYFMARILEGAYGNNYNVHMVFVNVLYGYILLPLYHFFPKICWYYIGELFAIFISFIVVDFVVIKKLGFQWGSVFALIISTAFATDYYLVTQFTQCASALSAAGFLALVYAIEYDCKNNRIGKFKIPMLYLAGFTLVAWGATMRWEAFLMGLPFLGIALLVRLDWCWKNKIKVISILFLLLVGTLGIHKFDDVHYSSSEYQTFRKFQPHRVLIGDFDNYDMNATYEDLDEMDLSSDNLIRLRGWFFYDKDNFSYDSLSPYVKSINNHIIHEDIDYLLNLGFAEFAKYIRFPITWPWILLSLLLIFFNKEKCVYVWLSLLVILTLMCYLIFIARNVYRVENGFFLYAVVQGISFLKEMPRVSRKWIVTILAIIVSATTIIFAIDSSIRDICSGEKILSSEKKRKKDYQGVLKYIENAPDSLIFIVSMQPFMGLAEQDKMPYLTRDFGCWKRIVSTGYWTPYFPDVEQTLREKNIVNPVKDAVNENVFVIGDRFDDYLQEYYYDSVSVNVVKSFDGISIDKYSVVERENQND